MSLTRELRCKLTEGERKAKADALASTISEHKHRGADGSDDHAGDWEIEPYLKGD